MTVLTLSLSACAQVWVHEDGSITMRGLLFATLPAKNTPDANNGSAITASSLGFLLFHTPTGSSLSFGYAKESFSVVPIGSDFSATNHIANTDPLQQ